MKFKKVAALFLVVMVAVTGCSKAVPETTSSTSTTDETKGVTVENIVETQEPVELTWFSDISFWAPPSVWSTDESTVQGQITKNTGVTFKMDIPPQDGGTKLSLMLVDGTLPDVITTNNGEMQRQLIDSGRVWKMEEFLTQYDPESHVLKDFPEDVKAAHVFNYGDWYSYPSHTNSVDARKVYAPSDQFYIDRVEKGTNPGIVFNGDLMEKAGITLADVQTEEGVMAALEKVKGLNLEVNGVPVVPLLINDVFYKNSEFNDSTLRYLANTFGAMPVTPEGNYRDLLLAPEMKHAFKFLNTALIKGYMDPNNLVIDNSAMNEYLVNERVFCFIGMTSNGGFTNSQTTNYVSPGAIESSEGKKPVVGINQQAAAGWMQTYVSKDCKYPEQAAKFISYMSSEEGMTTHLFGFEGVDYNLNEEGLIIKTEIGIQNNVDQSKTGVGAYWPFANGAFENSILPPPATDRDIMKAHISTALGNDPDTTIFDYAPFMFPASLIDPDSDLAVIDSQIIAFREAQIPKILMAKDEAAFNAAYDELIETYKKYGIDELDAVRNEEFKARSERYGVTIISVNGE